MSTSRIDLGLPLAVIELLARVGSIASITLLILLFAGEALHPSEISPLNGPAFFSFQSV